MEEKIHQGNLFDFYGDLLKEQQRRIFETYVCEDLSLSEIAEAEGMSRQGVHDIIRRATAKMEDYDAKLHLMARFDSMRQVLEMICKDTKASYEMLQQSRKMPEKEHAQASKDITRLKEHLSRIESLSRQLIDEL